MLERRRGPFVAQTVTVRGDHGVVRVLTAGRPGAPPLLLVHGLGMSAAYWTAFTFPALAARYRLIAPDLPGFGRSDPLPRHTLAAYVQVLERVLDEQAPGS